MQNYVDAILQARVYDVAEKTPLDSAPNLSARLHNTVLLKREDEQPVFSFKLRGAYNKMSQLSAAARERGVICASAGNHAQGVALAARHLGIKATIVMPRTTPAIKVNAVKQRGGKVVLHGDMYDDASEHAHKMAERDALTYVHPYDDPAVIAGQGTVAKEILDDHPAPIHAIFVPVGGGGLVAGVAAYVKQVRPEIKIIGVEPEDAPTLHTALAQNRRVTLKQVGLFADGVAVRQIGKETFKIAKALVDEVVLVSVDEICAAIRDNFEDTRAVVEPAGALAVAGIKKYVAEHGIAGETLIAINSGANINFNRLRHVAERAELGEQGEALLAVTIPERPGSFRDFCSVLGKRGITEFNYRLAASEQAQIFVGVALTEGMAEKAALIATLQAAGYPVLDLTDNEMAKLHLRYMVGGRAPEATDELLYRFEFPERPGALMQFLRKVGQRWNISLFHYRNHGAAYGRVLCGLQVPRAEHATLRESFEKLGYRYVDESKNPAYSLFLSN